MFKNRDTKADDVFERAHRDASPSAVESGTFEVEIHVEIAANTGQKAMCVSTAQSQPVRPAVPIDGDGAIPPLEKW
jgi:hypothetical protein